MRLMYNDQQIDVAAIGGGSDMHEYSTTEKEVGTWIDGSKVYEKVIEGGTAPAQGAIKSITHGITDLDLTLELTGFAIRANDGFTLLLPNISRGNTAAQTSLSINSTSVSINNGSASDLNTNFTIYLIVRYTKTA